MSTVDEYISIVISPLDVDFQGFADWEQTAQLGNQPISLFAIIIYVISYESKIGNFKSLFANINNGNQKKYWYELNPF